MAKRVCVTARKKRNRMLGIGAVCIALIILILTFAIKQRQIQDTFVPPSFDENAKQITADISLVETYGVVAAAEGYQVGICGKPNYADGYLEVQFTNPVENTVWMQLCIYDENDSILVETGLIRPGTYISSVHLNRQLQDRETIRMKVLGYQPDTYYSTGEVSLETIV